VGRSIGKALREFRRTTEEVRSSFEASLDDEPSPNGEVAPGAITDVEPEVRDHAGREPTTTAEPPGDEVEPGSPPADRG
jgi:Sec-independent protein translocase protein TatA